MASGNLWTQCEKEIIWICYGEIKKHHGKYGTKLQYKYNNLKNFYKNKNILVTGHTGFKGSWLTSFLKYLNANILGISIDKINQNDKSGFNRDLIDLEVISDINDLKNYSEQIKKFNPEIIFYLAAQPLVREAYINPLHTFKSNVMGLIEFLNFIKSYDHNIKTIIIIALGGKEVDF